MNSNKVCSLLLSIFFFIPLFSEFPQLEINKINDNSREITITFQIEKNDAVYQQYLDVSVDSPDVTLSSWKASIDSESIYDITFKENKNVFIQPFSISLKAEHSSAVDDATIHLTYYLRSQKKIAHTMFPISFNALENSNQVSTQEIAQASASAKKTEQPLTWTAYFSALLVNTNSFPIQLLMALLLGLLLSLTPCIYPMIPITLGILQAQGSKSVRRNFCLAASYTCGIATTFAMLGTIAAFSGAMMGSLLNKPIVILCISGFLAYMAGTMFGFYEMYIPTFLKPKQTAKGGSLISAFTFGAISGTVASPCLSPGLLLLLTIVTTLNNAIMGFVLLFAFGVGIGLPLLIIGTCSTSFLPKAGAWMIGVKHFFGWLLVGTSLYFLSSLMPWHLVLWIGALLVAIGGVHYARLASSPVLNVSSISCMAMSVLLCFQAFKATIIHRNQSDKDLWLHDYGQALIIAKQQNKKILLEVTGPFCSICRAIDKKILCNEQVCTEIQNFVPVKIENIEQNETTLALQKKFNILGVPTLLVINPEDETMCTRWGGELYESSPEQFCCLLREMY